MRTGIGNKISSVMKFQGAQNTPYGYYLPGFMTNLLRERENGFGRVTNLLLCCKKRPNSHGTRRSLSFAPCELSANSLLRLEDLTEEVCENPSTEVSTIDKRNSKLEKCLFMLVKCCIELQIGNSPMRWRNKENFVGSMPEMPIVIYF